MTKANPAIRAGLTKGTANLKKRAQLLKPNNFPASIKLRD